MWCQGVRATLRGGRRCRNTHGKSKKGTQVGQFKVAHCGQNSRQKGLSITPVGLALVREKYDPRKRYTEKREGKREKLLRKDRTKVGTKRVHI